MKEKYGFEKLAWEKARTSVAAVNPELARLIDVISPDHSFPLFKVSYPYGSKIIKSGVLQLPNKKGTFVSLHDLGISEQIKTHLGYNFGTNPVSLLLNKTVEIFFILGNKTIPLYGLIPPGEIFSTWKVLSIADSHSPAFLWDMTAGARSIFMLPKISENGGHTRIRKHYNVKSTKPAALLEQWFTFREIANSPHFKTSWQTEILFFGKKWFDRLLDKRFSAFRLYLYEKAWESSNYFRHQFIWNLIFSLIQERRHLKFDPYIANTVEHLLGIGLGVMPGFKLATNDIAAPIKKIMQAYREIYRLQKYEPLMFHPHRLCLKQQETVYYSLEYPTTTRFSPRSTSMANKLNDLIYIKIVLEKYLSELVNGGLNIHHTPLSKLPERVIYDYFHNKNNKEKIKLCEAVYRQDKTIRKVTRLDRFAVNSPFLQGCISITAKS